MQILYTVDSIRSTPTVAGEGGRNLEHCETQARKGLEQGEGKAGLRGRLHEISMRLQPIDFTSLDGLDF